MLELDLEDLEGIDQETAEPVVQSFCIRATSDIVDALELLGFIVNSTSVRNAFEVHQCLLDIANTLISNNAKLLLSFEWDYVPFTYPLNVPALPNFVVIGLPASEANNALIIPAAGHELGHSAWRYHSIDKNFELILRDTIINLIKNNHWADFLKFTSDLISLQEDVDGLIGRQLWKRSYEWSLSQVEELFCDVVGLIIFGTSYLHTYSYLLAPKFGEVRSGSYPSSKTRPIYLGRAAKSLGITVPTDFIERFEPQTEPYDKGQFSALLLQLADAAVEILFDEIYETAKSLCKDKGFIPPLEKDWAPLADAFRSSVPAANGNTLANIINAGWVVYRDRQGTTLLQSSARRPMVTINELLLKSIEVLEVENLLKGVDP